MTKESHSKAAESFKHASKHHEDAAKHSEAGDHEKAAHSASRRSRTAPRASSTPKMQPTRTRPSMVKKRSGRKFTTPSLNQGPSTSAGLGLFIAWLHKVSRGGHRQSIRYWFRSL